jgi:hypothetical protein
MESHPKAGNMGPGREILQETAMETIFADEKKSGVFAEDKSEGVYIDEKKLESSIPTSDSDGTSLYVYERDNMVRDETGRIVVETSELAITALHVDDDPSLSPWTFRTFFLGIYVSLLGWW